MIVPFAAALSGHKDDGKFEFRAKAPLPAWPSMVADVAAYPGRLDRYLGDSFFPRSELLRLRGRLKFAIGASDTDRVVVGRGGWLFYADYLEAAREPERAGSAAFAKWLNVMEARRRWLAERGIGFIATIGPDKQSIYPEYLPRGWTLPATANTDLLVEYLRSQHSLVTFVDLREPLRSHKGRGSLYSPSDTHWTALGALVAYQALTPVIRSYYPAFKAVEESQIVWQEGPPGGNMRRMMGLPDDDGFLNVMPAFKQNRIKHQRIEEEPGEEGAVWKTRIVESDVAGPRILALRDSFMDATGIFFYGSLEPFFSQSCATFVSYPHKGRDFPIDLIEKMHPDIVIWEIVERNLLLAGDAPPS